MKPEPTVPPRIDHAAIRRERIRTLLPRLMEAQQVEAWLTFTRENVPDPLLPVFGIGHIVARAAFLFTRTDGRFRATAMRSFPFEASDPPIGISWRTPRPASKRRLRQTDTGARRRHSRNQSGRRTSSSSPSRLSGGRGTSSIR